MKNRAAEPGPMRISPSAPTPKWRSHTRRTNSGPISTRFSRSSTTRKSLPVPCALTKSTVVPRLALGEPVQGPGRQLGPGRKVTPLHSRVPAGPGELAAGVAAGAGDDLVEHRGERGARLQPAACRKRVQHLLVAESLPGRARQRAGGKLAHLLDQTGLGHGGD